MLDDVLARDAIVCTYATATTPAAKTERAEREAASLKASKNKLVAEAEELVSLLPRPYTQATAKKVVCHTHTHTHTHTRLKRI